MCGRYFFDGETYKLIETLVDDGEDQQDELKRDFYPGEKIPVMIVQDNKLVLVSMTWGYSMKSTSQRVMNARSETLLEKKMFAEDAMHRRCIIPAKGFYEWDALKHKILFEDKQSSLLFMAGIYNEYNQEVTIITTSANDIMKPIHSRMPLMISQENIKQWITDDQSLKMFLSLKNNNIKITEGQIQQSLFE